MKLNDVCIILPEKDNQFNMSKYLIYMFLPVVVSSHIFFILFSTVLLVPNPGVRGPTDGCKVTFKEGEMIYK